jgi:hypothetical protein
VAQPLLAHHSHSVVVGSLLLLLCHLWPQAEKPQFPSGPTLALWGLGLFRRRGTVWRRPVTQPTFGGLEELLRRRRVQALLRRKGWWGSGSFGVYGTTPRLDLWLVPNALPSLELLRSLTAHGNLTYNRPNRLR